MSSNNAIRAILRLEAVPTHHTKELKRDNILVNSRVAEAVAEIVMFLGLNHTSSFETLSQAVSEGKILKEQPRCKITNESITDTTFRSCARMGTQSGRHITRQSWRVRASLLAQQWSIHRRRGPSEAGARVSDFVPNLQSCSAN